MKTEKECKEIFLSYHGGEGDESRSSYRLATELKDFFENHAGRRFRCFLCKKENPDDFYDAIQNALLETRHFILVATDRQMISPWVKEEIKQFDALRKTGCKQNCVINACIDGNINEKDLFSVNTLFTTKDIVHGKAAFPLLYDRICAAEQSEANLFACEDFTLRKIVNIPVGTDRIKDTLLRFSAETEREVSPAFFRQVREDLGVYEAFAAEKIAGETASEGALLVMHVDDPEEVARYLLRRACIRDAIYVFWDYNDAKCVVLTASDGLRESSAEKLEFRFANMTLHVESRDDFGEKVLLFSTGSDHPMRAEACHTCFDDAGIPYYDCAPDTMHWCRRRLPLEKNEFYYGFLQVLSRVPLPENSPVRAFIRKESDSLYDRLEFEDYDFSESAMAKRERAFIALRAECVLADETLLWEYYRAFKRDKVLDKEKLERLISTPYGEIAIRLKQYYQEHVPEHLEYVVRTLLSCAAEQKANGKYARYVILVAVLAEIFIHNIFILDYSFQRDNHIYDILREVYGTVYDPSARLSLRALLCAYEKEILFCGDYATIDKDKNRAFELVMSAYDECIRAISAEAEQDEGVHLGELFLLYRQRCVIWEYYGNGASHKAERRKYYTLWKEDCLTALSTCERFDPDKELMGCVYLNLASAINKLATMDNCFDEEVLGECLINIDNALEKLNGSSADRHLAYGYMHKSDGYNSLVIRKLAAGMDPVTPPMAEYIKEIGKNAMAAIRILDHMSDDTGKAWAYRLAARSRMLSAVGDHSVKTLQRGLEMLRQSLQYCRESNYVVGMAECVRDFTDALRIIGDCGKREDLSGEIADTFMAEMTTVASVIRFVDISSEEILEVQKQIDRMMAKMVDY